MIIIIIIIIVHSLSTSWNLRINTKNIALPYFIRLISLQFSRISVYQTALNYEISELFTSTFTIASRNFESDIFCSEKAGSASRFDERLSCWYTLIPPKGTGTQIVSSPFEPAIHLFRLYKITSGNGNNSRAISLVCIKSRIFLITKTINQITINQSFLYTFLQE